MWNKKKSLILSKWCVVIFMLLLLGVVAVCPWLVQVMVIYADPALTEAKQPLFMATIYIGALPAAYLLYLMLRLLGCIERGQVFIEDNVEILRRISWSCFVGAVIALVSVVYYLPWLFLAVAAAFMGLIVRVVKNMVAQAVELQDEVDCVI